MKYKVKRRIEGSVSVMMVIILLVTMVLSALIVDTSRINMARSMVSSAGDLAVNSALANYDTVLKDVYGLFAMSQAQSSEELNQEIREYFEKTLVSYGVTSEAEAGDYVAQLMGGVNDLVSGTGNMDVSNFLDMEIASFSVNKVDASGLDNPEILRRQIVDYMKYRAPMNFGLSFLDSVQAFTTINDQTKVVKTQVEAQESLQPVTQGCRTVIDCIRAYDSSVQAIDTGDQAVKGRDGSTDPNIVGIRQYPEQLDKYRQKWAENYDNINRLALVFLLKPPTISDRYLSAMSFTANQCFIHDDTLEADKGGISVNVELAETLEAAETQVIRQREKLTEEGQPNSYRNWQQTYCNADFLPEGNLNYDYTDYNDWEKAMNAYICYEAFLLNDDTGAPITYSMAAEILEQLCILEKYQDNYLALMEKHIKEQAAVRDAKKEEMDAKEEEVNQADKALGNAKSAKEDVTTKQSALATATSNKEAAESNLENAEADLKAYTGDNEKKISSLEEAVKLAKSALEEAEGKENEAKEAYQKAKEAEPSDEQIAALESELTKRQGEHAVLKTEYNKLKDKVQLLESQRDNHIAQYKQVIDTYMQFSNAYQRDQEWYIIYQDTARRVIAREAAAIQTQALKIRENVKKLTEGLTEIEAELTHLADAIKKYDEKVDLWSEENQKYAKKNSSDTFSKQNEADIAATEDQYNTDSLGQLLSYVHTLGDIYKDFYQYITDASHYKYGSVRIDAMAASDQILSAIPAGIKDALPDIVTEDLAESQLDLLYPEEPTPPLEIQKATFLTDGILPFQFLKYLNENFPVEEKKLVTNDGQQNSEQQYEDIKTQMKEEKKVGEEKSDSSKDPFGYTYRNHSIAENLLPSDLVKEHDSKTRNTASMSITEDKDGKVNASDSLEKQNKNLDSVLGNVGSVLETGLENVYIMDYIFENFSYNTMIQEMVVKEGQLKNYTDVFNISFHKDLSKCVGKARTLSNYSITGANNYLYGAEIEYILWGDSKPANNVTYTKGSIYAIRFAFNSIYAFTNSEIRNTTRAVGLAVQAATAGFVPYQLVQVVLQLALAAAESAIDLDMMSKGLKVVVVKTKDTWNMSISGAVGLIKDAATGVIEEVVDNAVLHVTEGVNTVLDASAEELQGAIDQLTDTVSNAAQNKGQEIVDGIYTELQSEIDKMLNHLGIVDPAASDGGVISQEQVQGQVDALFQQLSGKINEILAGYGGDPIADGLLDTVQKSITGDDGVLKDIQEKINGVIRSAYEGASGLVDIEAIISREMNQIKYDVIQILQKKVNKLEESVNQVAKEQIADITEQLKGYASECIEGAGEELTSAIKDKVVASMDNFSDKYLKDIDKPNLGAASSTKVSSAAKVASLVQFGYKDYLMLMLFIHVCADDKVILARTADLIQLNMQNAKGEKDQEGQLVFVHNRKNEFTMAEAKTYVAVQGNVKVEMLFLNMDFFNRLFVEDGVDVGEQVNAASSIQYNSVSGY